MLTNENSPLSPETLADRVITVHPSQVVAPAAASAWLPAAGPAAAEMAPAFPIAAVLGAVRRRWLAITLSACGAAVLLAVTAYFAIGPQYMATANLVLSTSAPEIIHGAGTNPEQGIPEAFLIFKETQQHLLRSTYVLTAALRDDTVKSLPTIRREELRHNAVNWLYNELIVNSPGRNTAVLAVGLKRPVPEEAAALVNAVIHAYIHECVDAETIQKQGRLNELQRLYSDKENEARLKRSQLQEACDRIGTSDTDVASARQTIAVQTYGDYRRELDKIRIELGRAKSQLATQQGLREQVGSIVVAEVQVQMLSRDDPQLKVLNERLMWMRMVAETNVSIVNDKGGAKHVVKSKRDMDLLEAQIKEINDNYRERVKALKRVDIEESIRKLEGEVAVLTDQEQQMKAEVERLRLAAEQLCRSSTDIEMKKAELKHLEQVFGTIAEEKQRLELELRSASRVAVYGNKEHPADVPEAEANFMFRTVMSLFVALVGSCLCAVGIVFWDTRFQRIGDSGEVSKNLGLPVLGSVPKIPASVLRRLGAPSKRNQAWRMRLTEAVDGLAARLLRKAEMEGVRVVLISSASAGEGKTTLATQLAMSLARHRRRTVLVDFDLRRPALDGIFGMSLEPGVCEILRSAGSVSPAARPTAIEHLAVLTAGRWDRQTLASLASGGAKTLLDQLRAEYDFVIVDSSPILPIADTRLVSQHVDTAILSVFRDVSQGPKVLAAYEILEAFGVQSVEAVVTGGQEHCYGKEADYEAASQGEQEPSLASAEGDDAPPSDAAGQADV